MYYSVTEKKLMVGKTPGEKRAVAYIVEQRERISFDKLCLVMSEGSTVSQADVVAVIYKLCGVLQQFCSLGYVVDAGPLGSFRPALRTKTAKDLKAFNSNEHILKVIMRFSPSRNFRELKNVEFHRINSVKDLKTPKDLKPNNEAPQQPGSGDVGSGL